MRSFGMQRVIEPRTSVPVSAWKLDNSREISREEARLRVKKIKLEEANFKQICNECSYDENKVKEKILDIIKKRGKLHNPSTDSGGMLYGIMDEMGSVYRKHHTIEVNGEVMCITSLTAIPLFLESIQHIDYNYGQLDVEGYCIVFDSSPLVPCPGNLHVAYTMYALDESSSLYRVFRLAEKGKRFLILGRDILSVLLYASAIRKAVGQDCWITAVVDIRLQEYLSKEQIRQMLNQSVDQCYMLDIFNPLKTFEMMKKKEKERFDFSINCADLLGAETVSVLLTKDQGSLFFTSLINNYNLAILFAESLGKELRTYSLDEYTDHYTDFTFALIEEIRANLDRIDEIYQAYPKINQLSAAAIERLHEKEVGRVDDFVFLSEKTRAVVEDVLHIAAYDCNVIIQGETGVGKENILRLIHKNSSRKLYPCIKINCAAIPDNLAESEFFGYEPGAFTGAVTGGKPGYFELANNGILFLDEVAELPLSLQSKLLRVLQEKQFYRMGGVRPKDVNVRVICASNIEVKRMVEEGRFREDLYYRLNICEIHLPALRERKEDVICLSQHFLQRFNEQYQQEKKIETGALRVLQEYPWPGNVRELENVIHRLVINSKATLITRQEIYHVLQLDFCPSAFPEEANEKDTLADRVSVYEKQMIEEALKQVKNTREAAALLGISQSQLMRKKQKYKIE